MVYIDTSALAALYLEQSITKKATQIASKLRSKLYLNGLQILEFYNAIMLGVFRKSITTKIARQIVLDFEEHFNSGLWIYKKMKWDDVFYKAVYISQKHSAKIGVRSLDIIHLAAATNSNASKIFSFDKRQILLAKKLGLRVL